MIDTIVRYNLYKSSDVDKLTAIHYGSTKYNPDLLGEIKNTSWVKPKGGLWVSPVNSSYGWKDWCGDNEFRECNECNSFKLKFKSDAKIIIIDCLDDLLCLPVQYNFMDVVDFEFLARHCDALWLTDKGQSKTRFSDTLHLYGWDCESILIFNKDCCYQI